MRARCIKQAHTLLDVHTEGGIKVLLDAIEGLRTTPQAQPPAPAPAA